MLRLAVILNFKRVKLPLNQSLLIASYSFTNKILIMKKLFLLAFAATMSTALFAQTTPTKKEERKGVRNDVKDIKQDKKELKSDVKNGDKNDARLKRQDIKNDRKDIKQDSRDLGIKHPVRHIRRHPRHH